MGTQNTSFVFLVVSIGPGQLQRIPNKEQQAQIHTSSKDQGPSITPASCITSGFCVPRNANPPPPHRATTHQYNRWDAPVTRLPGGSDNESHFVVPKPLYYGPNFGSPPHYKITRRGRPPASHRAPVTPQRREWPGEFSYHSSSSASLSLVCQCSSDGRTPFWIGGSPREWKWTVVAPF